MTEPSEVVRVPRIAVGKEELRRIFNDGGFTERIQAGELRPTYVRDWIPDNVMQLDREPPETRPYLRSQIIEYRDTDDALVLRVHCYRRPDGSIAGSGKLDPVKVVWNGVLYVQSRQRADPGTSAPPE